MSTGKSKTDAGQNRPGIVAFLHPRPPLRSFTKECAQNKTLSGPVVARRNQRGLCTADSSEPAPSHRPWVLAPSATSARITSH